jgi:hypothetical protein
MITHAATVAILRSRWWFAAILLSLCLPFSLVAQTNSQPKMLFLHLRLKGGVITLLDSVSQKGVVKRPRLDGTLHYQMFSSKGQGLWAGAMPNPALRELEYEEPVGSRNFKRKTVVMDPAEFTLRVPALPDANRLEFFTLVSDPSDSTVSTKRLLGTVMLP